MTRRRIAVLVAACMGCAVAAYVVVPQMIERRLRSELVGQGFPDARLEVTSIGLHHLQLGDVHLQPGVDLGSVRLTPGRVAIRGARVSLEKLAALGQAFAAAPSKKRDSGALEITIEASEPSPGGWSVDATARVAWRDREISVRANGTARVPRVSVGPYSLRDVSVPFAFDENGLDITGATAGFAGGQLRLDGNGADLVLQARGLQLAELLRPTRRVSGTALVDGEVTVRFGESGAQLIHGSLRARAPGTLGVSDQGLRERVANANAPLAVHAKVAAALLDFRFSALALELQPEGTNPDLRLVLRGEGRTNHQQLDIAVGVRGVREVVLPRLIGGGAK